MNSRLDKHLGHAQPLVINDEEFMLEQLDIDYLPHFFKLMRNVPQSGKDGKVNISEFLKSMNDAELNILKELIDKTLELSLPDEPIDKRKKFGLRYMGQLLAKILEINSSSIKSDKAKSSQKLHDLVKQHREQHAPKPKQDTSTN